MDIMIPFLGRITRLQLESKGAFHIAGVKDANVQKLELEKRQKREVERQKKLVKTKEEQNTDANKHDKNEEGHLDTWA